jgi:microsomal dipeptidase-like Zn-dependent dipeptidase
MAETEGGERQFLVDLHAHYPMHIHPGIRWEWLHLARKRARVPFRLHRARRDAHGVLDWLRGLGVDIASLVMNYRSLFSGPRVRMEYMREGNVGVALSVVYSFFDEADGLVGNPPNGDYIGRVLDEIDAVTNHVVDKWSDEAAVVTSGAELEAAIGAGKTAIAHCVEGGFHLGGTVDEVTSAVGQLADAGIAYVTLAHLIYREIATDAPALPFLTEDQYEEWFPQPSDVGLTPLGEAAVRAMVEGHVLIDVSHMSERAMKATFALLDELDPAKSVPVIATHGGYRFGGQEYMLADWAIREIAERDGVFGLIFAQHQLYDGLYDGANPLPGAPPKPTDFASSFELLEFHIQRIHEVLGTHRHTAIGSDLDGFIKPVLPGLEDMREMKPLQEALRKKHGADGEAICAGNALRVLRGYWGG